ncbi:MAG TPA: hypothetical protein VH413_11415 [Verrucomicrobiae bacterium]|jgi:hypothetical protein|nr:hypothetical protein [Verrucomicrobiae bacterium]
MLSEAEKQTANKIGDMLFALFVIVVGLILFCLLTSLLFTGPATVAVVQTAESPPSQAISPPSIRFKPAPILPSPPRGPISSTRNPNSNRFEQSNGNSDGLQRPPATGAATAQFNGDYPYNRHIEAQKAFDPEQYREESERSIYVQEGTSITLDNNEVVTIIGNDILINQRGLGTIIATGNNIQINQESSGTVILNGNDNFINEHSSGVVRANGLNTVVNIQRGQLIERHFFPNPVTVRFQNVGFLGGQISRDLPYVQSIPYLPMNHRPLYYSNPSRNGFNTYRGRRHR